MRLLLLGSTGYHPNDLRHTACLMLPEIGVVLDAGTGMYRVREYLATDTLDIFLTHAHLDHVVGITYLFDVLHGRSTSRVTVRAEARKLEAIERHLLAEPIFPAPLPCTFEPLAAETRLGAAGRLRWFPVEHPGGAVGFRLDWPGRSLAYVTDTIASPSAPYVEQIRGADLLVHECYFPDGMEELARKTGHSWTSAVAETAKAAEAHRLILVHANPLSTEQDPIGLPTARAIFPRTELGYDRMEIDF